LNMACYSMGFEHHVMSGSIDRGPGAAHRRGISAFPDIAGELSRARQVPRANGSTTLTARSLPLPKTLHTKQFHRGIVGDKCCAFDDGLCREHPVKWIPMHDVEAACLDRMLI